MPEQDDWIYPGKEGQYRTGPSMVCNAFVCRCGKTATPGLTVFCPTAVLLYPVTSITGQSEVPHPFLLIFQLLVHFLWVLHFEYRNLSQQNVRNFCQKRTCAELGIGL